MELYYPLKDKLHYFTELLSESKSTIVRIMGTEIDRNNYGTEE